MRGFRGYRPGFGRRGRAPMGGAIWMIGLAVLFFSGHWWPGILVLIGISMVFSALMRSSQPQDDPSQPLPMPSSAPVFIPNPSPAPAPVSYAPHPDVLPGSCPRCGAPVRVNEVKWNGTHSAACSYCGSTLSMTRN